MLGVELDRPCGELVERVLERGVLINVTAERTVRLLPPLVIDEEQADQIVRAVNDAVREYCSGP
jgi:acetylornithine aminotransferase